ncbi:MotA/TolQ/ExbB proton channel family protein [Luteolibacter soli]|uniref:MotA/TolQ/ExbB proton channel family protein n=1 Tax=Luteolibacter soli TaxID=3135280 RepID=A0ABU9AT19_9BACT
MAQPYLPPEAPAAPPAPEEITARQRFWKRAIWSSSMLTAFPTLLGIGATVMSMMSAFSDLGASGFGDTEQWSVHIGLLLCPAAIGLTIGFVGLILLVISINRYREARSKLSP